MNASEGVVDCYAGAYYPERPRAFVWRDERFEVTRIERQWRSPRGLAFRVLTADGRRFLLEYAETIAQWRISPLRSPRPN